MRSGCFRGLGVGCGARAAGLKWTDRQSKIGFRPGLGTVVPESTERIHGHQTHSLRTDPRTTDHGELEGEERSPFTDHGPRTTV